MAENRLPTELTDLLARLRARIQRYVLLEGLSIVLIALGVLFWISLGLDWSYFRLQRAELPKWVRFVIEVAGLATCLILLFTWVAIRFWRKFQQRALALVLERRFPQLNDRLITAIELGQKPASGQPPLTDALLQQTIEEVRTVTGQLELNQVFDQRPLMRAGVSASCLLLSIVVFALTFSDVFGLWFQRNVLLADVAWKRENGIHMVVLAEPGERPIEFRDGVYKHPRGSDLTLLAAVVPGKKVPSQVQLRYTMTDGSASGRAYFSRLGTDQFKHTITGVLSDLNFYVLAGDATRQTYRIEVVDPPRIDQVVLNALFPQYTAWNQVNDNGEIERTPKPVLGSQISLPVGTDFQLQATCNKPLVSVRLQTETYDLEFDQQQAQLTLFQQDGQTRGGSFKVPNSAGWLSDDGQTFRVPFLLGHPKDQQVVSEQGDVAVPLRLPPDATIKIFLADRDDIRTAEPTRLAISSIADEAPKIETQLRGIGSSITRKAVIPVTGLITDDYGVAGAQFDFRVDTTDSQKREFASQPNGAKSFALSQSPQQPWFKFEVLPLELKLDQKLILQVTAQDGDTLSGPHAAQGEKYTFTVVSDEDLLSLLYARELNLRQRFEQILSEVQRTQTELTIARKSVTEFMQQKSAGAQTSTEPVSSVTETESPAQASATAAERALYGIRKNHSEMQAIGQSLGDIREEMVNNAVDTPQTLDRIDSKLLKPLNSLNDKDFPDVDQRLGLFRLALDEQTDPIARLDESLVALEALKRKMEQILNEMRKLETYKELLEILKEIRAQQAELKKRTETENKRSIINKLK